MLKTLRNYMVLSWLFLAVLIAVLVAIGPVRRAHAQSNWVTPGGAQVNGAVEMCLNASNQAVPISSGLCANVTVPLPTVSLGQATKANSLPVTIASDQNPDLCATAAKSSAPITVASATTTSLVAVSGATAVYVCGFSMTIAPSATAAATALFEYGTGAACTGTHALTGTFGNGDLTSAVGVTPISYGDGGHTIFTAPASNGVCIVTAGTAVSVQGVLTYVQQ